MKIKLGDFGNIVAPAVTGARMPTSAFVADATGLGATAQRAAAGLLEADRREQEKKRVELRRVQQVAAYAGFQADVDDITEGLTTELAEKKVKRDDMGEQLATRLDEAKKKRLEGLDAEAQTAVGAHFITADRRARRIVNRAVDLDLRQERTAQLNTALEEFGRVGVRDPAGAVKQVNILLDADGPGLLGADKVAGAKQSFAERAWAGHFADRILRSRGDAAGLAKLETEIDANATLDPDRKSVLIGRVMSQRETLEAKAARAEQSRLRTIEHNINEVNTKITLQGYDPPADQLLAIQAAAKGTELEPKARQMVAFANETLKYRSLPPRAQEVYENDLEAKIRQNPTPELIGFRDRIKAIGANQRELIRTDIVSFGAQKGVADIQPIDFTKLDSLSDQMHARLTAWRGLRAQYGGNSGPLTKQESGALTELLRSGTPQGKSLILGGLSRTLADDTEGYKAIMNQVRPDDPVTAIGGTYAATRARAPAGQTAAGSSAAVSDLIFAGQQILHPKKKEDGSPDTGKLIPMPADKDMRVTWDNYVRDAYAGNAEARSAYFQTAQAIYAKLSVDAGDKDTSIFKDNRWKTAMQLATGGVETYRGKRTPMPYGMSLGDFKDGVSGRAQRLATSGLLGEKWTADKLRDLPLEPQGDGRYVFRAGDGIVVNKSGDPVFIDFNEPAPLPPDLTSPPTEAELRQAEQPYLGITRPRRR